MLDLLLPDGLSSMAVARLANIFFKLNSLILGLFFLAKRENRPANFILALFFFTIIVDNVRFEIGIIGNNGEFLIKYTVFHLSSLIVYGPLFYLYTRLMATDNSSLQLKDILHFLPFIFWGIFSVYRFSELQTVMDADDEERVLALHSFYNIVRGIFITLSVCHLAIYLFYTNKIIKKYEAWIPDQYSNLYGIQLKWLKDLNLLVLTLLVVYVVAETTIAVFFEKAEELYLFFHFILFLSCYWVALHGYQIGELPKLNYSGQTEKEEEVDPAVYKEAQRIHQFILENRLYLNADLKIADLANRLQMPKHRLSSVINKGLQKSFFDVINEARINAAKEKLLDPAMQHLSLDAIAYDCGYNSRSSFYEMFKKITGLTPKEYQSNTPIK